MSSSTRWHRLIIGGIVALATAIAFAACGGDDDDGESSDAGAGGTLGVLIDEPRNDNSFGEATFSGAERAAQEFDLDLSVVDSLSGKVQEAQQALDNFASDSDYVINGASATYQTAPRVAQEFPDTQFRVYAVPVTQDPNLFSAVQDWYPLGYLAGVVAARTTDSGVVGFVGGAEIPPTTRGLEGYEAGVEDTDPSVEVLSAITGSFSDSTKGKSATAAQIASDADVVYSFLDAAHEGAVQAASEADDEVKLMGVIAPKCELSDGLDLGDTLFRQDELIYTLVEQMINGEGEDIVYELEDPKIQGFEFCPGESTPELESDLEDVREAFNSGDLTAPPL
ncbi:MAG: BMP family protein [Solirubrobacterales bacterium]